MKQEEKQLLLQDLCARLPYGFFIHRKSDNSDIKINDIDDFAHFLEYSNGEEFKPYLRPMSSMTEEEKQEYDALFYKDEEGASICNNDVWFDFMNSHFLDYRGFIEKGIALEAPEEMYKNK